MAGFLESGEIRDVFRQEVVQHRPDHGDDGQLPDVLPGGGDGRVHDVGGERELEREQDPSGEFEPDLPSAELVRGAREDRADDGDDRLGRSERDDDDRAHLDSKRDIVRDDVEIVLDRNGAVPLADAGKTKPIRLSPELPGEGRGRRG